MLFSIRKKRKKFIYQKTFTFGQETNIDFSRI